jgi:3-hydroxyacyl-CoA dehydrogenase
LTDEKKIPISRVLIVGAGWVGRQIGAKLVGSGIDVGLTDRDDNIIEQAACWITQSEFLPHLLPTASKGVASDPHSRLHASTRTHRSDGEVVSDNQLDGKPLNPARGSVRGFASLPNLTLEQINQWMPQLVIESVPEQLSLKKRVLKTISQLVPVDCIIASNTSYFVPSVLSRFVTAPERYAQMHFHVPVLKDSVVDIVGCEQTEPAVLMRLAALSEQIGQYPLMMKKEHPGYVFNWLLQSVLKAALELVALDVVDYEDVDRSWKSVTGMSLGPFGMMDQIGLDVIDQVLSNARWAEPIKVSEQQLLEILRPLMQQGKLGKKSGAGFYTYDGPEEQSL